MKKQKRPEIVLPALRPNLGIEAAYRKLLQELVRDMACSMIVHIRAAYGDTDVGFAMDADPIIRLRRAMTKWGRRWTEKLEDASTDIAELFAKRVRADTQRRMMNHLKRAGFTVDFKPSAAMTQAYRLTVAQNVNLIKSIPAQFLKDVQSNVWESVMKGHDMGALREKIQKSYGIGYRRAALIARDQNNKARAVMEEARRSELGITQAIWVHSGGGKHPRPEHVKWGAQGKRYHIKHGMWSTVDSEYVWPGTAINCRCISRSVIPAMQ